MKCHLIRQSVFLLGLITLNACQQNEVDKGLSCKQQRAIDYRINQARIDEGLHHRAAEYFTELKFGAGGQVIDVVADTGSANLVVNGNSQLCPNCKGQSYAPGASATTDGEKITLRYGSGTGHAIEYLDEVSLTCGDPVSYRFGVWTEPNELPSILGLAYNSGMTLAETGNRDLVPFFDQLVSKHNYENKFSMLLCGHRGGSHIELGGADERVKESDILFYAPIVEKSYYVVNAKSLRFRGGEVIGSFKGLSEGTKTIIDSGTTMLFLPQEMVDKIIPRLKLAAQQNNIDIDEDFWATSPAQGSIPTHQFAEQELAKFPTLEIVLADKEGKDLPALEISPDTYFKDWNDPQTRVFGLRIARPSLIILGQPFMENYYMVFDRINDRVGFVSNEGLCEGK